MTIRKLGDAQADYDAWKAVRRGYLSSSEIFSWLDDTPAWWSDGPDEVLQGKVEGYEKEFDSETMTTILHGQYDEQNIQRKFGHAVGCDVQSDNGFYVNSKFPGIGASIDGWGRPWDYDGVDITLDDAPEVLADFSQDRELLPYLRTVIDEEGTRFLTEIKKSLSVKWRSEVPEYYVSQVKTQLAVLEVDYAIIVAETIHKGATQKWRQYWDLRGYVIRRDPAWDRVLVREGEKFLTALGG